MNITVAISGGADSLFALLFLKEQGHTVTALYARFLPATHGEDPVPALEALCRDIGVPLHVADLTEPFRRFVQEPFALAHAEARTPNPCALCNRAMKFGLLLDEAMTYADVFATGHYTSMEEHPVYGPALRAGQDGAKDQSYFLALVPVARLRRCIFPLATWKKPDIRAWLAEHGRKPPLPSESQEICFIPAAEDAYRDFLRRQWAAQGLPVPAGGPVVLEDGREIGRHGGLWRHTEGQRRGLGIAWSEPLYVLGKDRDSNSLIVGPRDRLGMRACRARQVVLHVPPRLWPATVLARVRHRQRPAPAQVVLDGDTLRITPHESQFPGAPGQIAAVYSMDGHVLAGGILDQIAMLPR